MTDNTSNSKWIGDGSEGGKLDVTNSSTITFASATQGTPFNVRLDAPVADSYYEVKVVEGSLGVGLVTENGFKPGWATRGCFYNGNITNGIAGLTIGFGKYISEGDVVGVYLQRVQDDAGGKCNIIFYINGRCLGAGFSLDDKNEKFFPCLHVSGSATVTYSVPSSPTVFMREQEVHNNNDPYSGDWAINQAFHGPELSVLPLPENSTLKVSFEKIEAQAYRLSVKIANSMRTSFKITGKMEAFDKIAFQGGCMSTRMMPSPDFEKVEQFIESAVDRKGGFQKMIISEDGKLIMSGPTAEMICSRFVETFEPVRSIS